jgi:hypothetical protein
LQDLVRRGLDPTRPRLFVIDGSRALRCAIAAVVGTDQLVPRGLTPLHEFCPIVYLMGVAQRSICLEDRIGGAAPWTTSPASAV